MKTSAKLYDDGVVAEAKRLAVSIRVLVHDTNNSKSLLGQLGMKAQQFVDTTSERTRNVITSYSGLVGTLLHPGPPEYVPNLNRVPFKLVPFEQWWEAPIIIDFKQRAITRKRLILAVSNQDGGAHVDPELDDIYADLSRDNSMSRLYSSGASLQPLVGVEHASVRQVAHELLCTLDQSSAQTSRQNKKGLIVGGFELHFSDDAPSPPVGKVGRNESCPCGSGMKYKKCHGK
ncbi:MAG: SEC-C metal-binding domain-containing protein [Nitrospirota bacterium]